uniref:LOW QUALITY PROTEIN: sphingolipid delta(4)-desaturase DES1-like n=1 Tax=Styela clava TaxID=7725 RepID=UPI00193AA42F|nr:LOW QUALITY PROTEIN: sphingolipid delta(4)-desaturase DES1-like [Styela clava]
MGGYVTRERFEWDYSDQPHTDRRIQMLSQYPQLKRLMKVNPHFKWVVCAQVAAQFVACYLVRDLSWPWLLLWAYILGGTLNHSLTLAIHEMSHNQAYGHGSKSRWNGIFAMFANLPIGIPYSVSFKKYHLDHHRCQGVDGIDTDIPTEFEGVLFCTTLRKSLWVLLQPLLYAIRPLYINPKPLHNKTSSMPLAQITFNVFLVWMWGGRALAYLLIGTYLGLAIHPVSGHFISEHYMFLKGHETYSYYGPLNMLTYNVGYHMEHHDFPSIPGAKLPLVQKIAPDFYDDLPRHDSWPGVIKEFITDPDVGPYSRIKRKDYSGQNGKDQNANGKIFNGEISK